MQIRKITYTYEMPALSDDAAGNLALFLTINEGSCFARWSGHMRAADQRALFGRFLGKGRLIINGSTERVVMVVKVCFGLDTSCLADIAWRDLTAGEQISNYQP